MRLQGTLGARGNVHIVLSATFSGGVSVVARCQGVPKAPEARRWAIVKTRKKKPVR